ncbi:hypothetical protein G9A89_014490 [Geosiphon pyriformis]|nr:hypothetical protein G9A89_014490 [Geosiphon pyriformis]
MSNTNFSKKCWIEKKHIHSTITSKNLSVVWVKIKSYSGIVTNKRADFFTDAATSSKFVLPVGVMHHFLAVESRPVSGNAFWHPDGSICSDFFSFAFVVFRSYFIKALHHWLPTVKRKKLYKSSYSSILYIYCSLTDNSDHVFLCKKNSDAKKKLIFNMIYYLGAKCQAEGWSCKEICDFGIRLDIHMCFGLHSGLASMHFGFPHNFSVVGSLGV